MVFQGKKVDFGRLGTLGCPFGPNPSVGAAFCARWKFLEGLYGSAGQRVGDRPWSPTHPFLWEAPFPDSAGRNLLPRDQLTWGRSSNCCTWHSRRGTEGLRGGWWSRIPSRYCHGSPSMAPGHPNPTTGQGLARERGNSPESLSGVQRERCEDWGCFPGLEAVGKSVLTSLPRPPSAARAAGAVRELSEARGDRGALPAGCGQGGTKQRVRLTERITALLFALARSRPPRPALPARSRTEIRPGLGRERGRGCASARRVATGSGVKLSARRSTDPYRALRCRRGPRPAGNNPKLPKSEP